MKNFLGELEKSSYLLEKSSYSLEKSSYLLEKSSYLLEKSCHEPESLDKTRQNNIDETTAELGEKVI